MKRGASAGAQGGHAASGGGCRGDQGRARRGSTGGGMHAPAARAGAARQQTVAACRPSGPAPPESSSTGCQLHQGIAQARALQGDSHCCARGAAYPLDQRAPRPSTCRRPSVWRARQVRGQDIDLSDRPANVLQSHHQLKQPPGTPAAGPRPREPSRLPPALWNAPLTAGTGGSAHEHGAQPRERAGPSRARRGGAPLHCCVLAAAARLFASPPPATGGAAAPSHGRGGHGRRGCGGRRDRSRGGAPRTRAFGARENLWRRAV